MRKSERSGRAELAAAAALAYCRGMKGPPLPATSPGPSRGATALLAILTCLLWSSAFAVIKISLAHMQPLTLAGIRFVLAGSLLLPFAGGPGAVVRGLKRHWRFVGTVSLLQTVVLYGTFFMGMSLVSAAHGAIVVGSSPLMAAVLAHFVMPNDRMTLGKAAAIALGVAGVAILAAGGDLRGPEGLKQIVGIGLLLVSSASSAVANCVVARNPAAVHPVLLNSTQIGMGGAVLLVVGLIVEGPPAAWPPAPFFAALLWLAGISAAGFSMWFALLRHAKVSELNMWKFLFPVFGAGIGWIVLDSESPDLHSVAGVVRVSAAVLMNYRSALRAAPAARPLPPA